MAMTDSVFLALEGIRLSAEEAAALEATLGSTDDEVQTRAKLLGYLQRPSIFDPTLNAKRAEHTLWFLRRKPLDGIVGSPYCSFASPKSDAPPEVLAAWESILAQPDLDGPTFVHAANFFSLLDPDRKLSILADATARFPEEPYWHETLGVDVMRAHSVSLRGHKPPATDSDVEEYRLCLASTALPHFERALTLTRQRGHSNVGLLAKAAQAAYAAAEYSDAAAYAHEALRLAPECGSTHQPDYEHWAHTVLGRCSLLDGDVEAATNHLAICGELGSLQAPVLRSFGPDFSLANELIDQGETAAVVSYLEQCKTFWMNGGRVDRWLEELRMGGSPWLFTGFDPEEPRPNRAS